MKTTFNFKHKALGVYESSTAHCVDKVSTNPASAYSPSFVHLAQKNREPTNTSTNYCSLIIHKTLWSILHQFGGVVTFTLRKNLTHPSCY